MKLSDLVAKVTELAQKIAGLETQAKAANITPEQHTALAAEAAALTGAVTKLQGDLKTALDAQAAAEQANATAVADLNAQVVKLQGELANKQSIATKAVVAAAELAADQTVRPVAANTDAPINGKSPLENVQAQLATEKDPAARRALVLKSRELRGMSFKSELVKAT
jgi:hypothetical protein